MVCHLNQQNWMYGAQVWRQPTREQCIAEFGAEAGPRLFAGGYHAIEGERNRRKELAAKPVAATPKPVAKPAPVVDPRIAELKRHEGEVAKLQRCVALKAEHDRLAKERDALQSQLAARNAPKLRGMASKLKFGGEKFNAFKPNGTAA
jgi:hypothetical protein